MEIGRRIEIDANQYLEVPTQSSLCFAWISAVVESEGRFVLSAE